MPLFIPIYKVDEEQRMVYGRLTDETPDRQGEIVDYAGTAPLIRKWSEKAAKLTDGKSLGNVREQHDFTRAVGKITDLALNDEQKSVELAAKIVDDASWAKCREGVLTGFSIGGKYVGNPKLDKDHPGFKRVVIDPNEASLVDVGANPSATFTAVKADGITEERAFKISARADADPKEGKEKYGDVEFADAKNKKYPIDTEAHIRAAWNYIHKKKNRAEYSAEDAQSIEDKIAAAWRKKIDPKGPPSAESAKAAHAEARKGMWDVSTLASILQALFGMAQSVRLESEIEGDDSKVPDKLEGVLDDLGDVFLEMAQEELDELVDGLTPAAT